MTVRSLAAGIAAVLCLGTLSGCSQEPPSCTLNEVAFSKTSVVIRGVRAREMRFDLSVGHLGPSGLRGPVLDVYDVAKRRDLGGPPVGADVPVYLPEGHRFRLTVKMALMDGRQLKCGVKTVFVPLSKGGMVPGPSVSQPVAGA